MPKKNVKKSTTVEDVLIAAAKTIGKAAGKIASVVGATAKTDSSPIRSPRPKRIVKKSAKPGTKAKESNPMKKRAAINASASKTKTTRRKSK